MSGSDYAKESSKFPVTSQNGNEYQVEVFYRYDSFFGWIHEVDVYRKDTPKWYNKNRFKKVHDRKYVMDFDGSLVDLVKDVVFEYEELKRQKEKRKNSLDTQFKEFEKWNGKM